MERGYLKKKKKKADQRQDHEFTKLIFSWSLDDILNEDLYKRQVEKIPLIFQTEGHYLHSFVYPLLEETRAELASSMEILYRAPYAEIFSFSVDKHKSNEDLLYDVTVGTWGNTFSEHGKEPYRILPGDLLILTDGKPKSVSELQHVGSRWAFLLVKNIPDDDDENNSTSVNFKVKASQEIEPQEGMFVAFLIQTTAQKRIWNSLRMNGNLNIIREVLHPDHVVKEHCDICYVDFDDLYFEKFDPNIWSMLNESQRGAIMASLCKTKCCHNSSVEQIWGPPGTGKTMTVSVLLFILLKMNRRMLTCAPTNVAVVQLASRVLSLVKESFKTITASGASFYAIGDLLLFGNKERLKVGSDVEDIYIEHRIKRLRECLGPLTGWKHCIRAMTDFLEDCVSQYHVFVENELFKKEQLAKENPNETKTKKLKVQSFIKFVRHRFTSYALPLRRCIVTFCTHVSKGFMTEYNFQKMVSLLDDLSSLESLLFQDNLVSEELEQLFSSKSLEDESSKLGYMSSINFVRFKAISVLKTLQLSLESLGLPSVLSKYGIMDFCFERASLVFCTTSSSYKLRSVKMKPLDILVIDEAAQLKEAESTIPLQLHGMKHAILIGDECQLPAMVTSNVSIEAGFGRSLFERLSALGHSKRLLNIQYRMHPSISFFPNWKFYRNQILNGENVSCKGYGKQYLPGQMFGSYSFINVVGGREEKDDKGRSRRNMVEVALVIKIVQNLYKGWKKSKKKLTIGVVSPYAAQVVSIQDKLAHKYAKLDGFSVKVRSIDGFQGGEEDIIILSTVRSNRHGSIGFMSSPQRINVALTRARHCLWILGNERTLANSQSVWREIVNDARYRNCLFDADADECLKMTIIDAKKELEQLDDLVNSDSVLFKNVKWKVLFSGNFQRSFGNLLSSKLKKVVLDFLLRLLGGWRPKNRSVDLSCGKSSHFVKLFKVEGLYVICTNDIVKESEYLQVLKVWDILPYDEIPKLTKRLESIFSAYTDDYISLCTSKSVDGKLEVPRSWPASTEMIRFCDYIGNGEGESEVRAGEGINYVENSKVSESLLLMKFYSLSNGVVKHLLSGKKLDLPMQVTDEQMDIVLSGKSSFIIGGSGTGKTTVLTMKLFQNEKTAHITSDGLYQESSRVKDAEVVNDPERSKLKFLRQLFVTISPKSCYAVKQHVSHLTRISCKGNSSAEINVDNADVASELDDVPDTFVDLPKKKYPLVITFLKFLMMLDGTLGNSFFERFHEATEGSAALRKFIRLRNVTFDRFCSHYWPHFNSNLTKRLDPSRVFNEIISHIKGGLQAGESHDGKLSCEGYSLLSKNRSSTLSKQKRETVYTLFQAYEKMKNERREFDLGDLVLDLHQRLKSRKYVGDQMDFVYIDEVQDLSMRQISLFKYICQNVDEGFVFAGDTARTIARGIDCRFEDIRSLFYTEFLSTRRTQKQEKGLVSEFFQLKQNFRTHAGVLNLAQSVIDVLYCYFAHSMDILEPETSLTSGEAPVLLECGNDENAIVKIFCGTGTSGEMVGFGAEQVILVRDECVKAEICKHIGQQAIVLTVAECKGLEFQDVLLYNFFGTSPLKDQWRVIYEYMKDQDWVDEKRFHSFPSFNEARHNVLCSELKQLYVAITRTRQRLWICENKEELSKPMFDYWKWRGLVQVRKLDESVAQAMQVASSSEEWQECGKKLYYENNFVAATMCFERAGDTKWETGLLASADQMRGTNPEAYSSNLREAAKIFESIGKLESAATCYCDLGEYERAGKIYMDKCGKLNEAAECFMLGGCYSNAAEAYAKGDQFSNCLSICKKERLFDKGMEYIEYRKKHVNVRSKETEEIEQAFLQSCALDYHEHKDPNSMMKFVRAFCSMESKRAFLRSLGCLDDLLSLEEETGHFLEAAELVRSWGDVLKEADFLEKAGNYNKASSLILWYLFSNSLKQCALKEELCAKAKTLAKKGTDNFYGFVCSELKVLSDEQSNLSEMKIYLQNSQQHPSLRGEMLLSRKILDAHLHLNSSKYDWDDRLPFDLKKYCEDKILQNRVSVRTLVFYWNFFKDNVLSVFKSLGSLNNDEPNEQGGHVDFSLNYFGVRKQCVEGNTVFLVVNEEADWIRNAGNMVTGGLLRDGKRLTIDGRQLMGAIRSYWQSELISVGIKVLEMLEGLHKLKKKGSAFHQCTSLLHIFEVSKFLLDCQHLKLKNPFKETLQSFLGISTSYFDLVFPLDWRKSVSEDLFSLQQTDLSLNLLEEIILQNVNIKCNLTYSTIGRVVMICLGYRQPVALYDKIIARLEATSAWKPFFELFFNGRMQDVYIAQSLQKALEDTYSANWRAPGYISLNCFVHLLDRLLFLASSSSGIFFTTKSSFLGCYTHVHSSSTSNTTTSSKQLLSDHVVSFIIGIVQRILYERHDTIQWIRSSNINPSFYHPLLVLKLLVILSLLCLHISDCSQVLLGSLMNFAQFLPKTFVSNLLQRRRGRYLNLNPDVVAEAFMCIYDPLLIVSSENSSRRIHAPSAVFVDLRRSRVEIMSTLFPRKATRIAHSSSHDIGVGKILDPPSLMNALPDATNKTVTGQESKVGENEASASSNIAEAHQEEYQVKETGDEGCDGDDVVQETVKKQSNTNTQDTRSKKGKGNNRGKKGKKGKGKK